MTDVLCEKHGWWDPTVGYRRCPGCASTITRKRLGSKFYAMHPLDVNLEVLKDAMRTDA